MTGFHAQSAQQALQVQFALNVLQVILLLIALSACLPTTHQQPNVCPAALSAQIATPAMTAPPAQHAPLAITIQPAQLAQ